MNVTDFRLTKCKIKYNYREMITIDNKLRIGIVGLGNIAQKYIYLFLQKKQLGL